MQRLIGWLVLVAWIPMLAAETPKTETKKKQTFGSFEILMPGEAKASSQKIGKSTLKMWIVETPNVVKLVSSMDIPDLKGATAEQIAETLEKSTTSHIQGMKGKELKRTKVTMDKAIPGIEVESEIPGPEGQKGYTKSRLCIHDGQLYQIVILGEKEAVAKDSKEFLESFGVKK